MILSDTLEVVEDFAPFGIRAFTSTRASGTFGSAGSEPVREVMGRWDALRALLREHGVRRLATASQVHGSRVVEHVPGWQGWLRSDEADGHISAGRGTAMAVTIADCVPVFLAHPSGACAVLHSGWRGTAARIVEQGIRAFETLGLPAAELLMHLGPAICGRCYEVSPDVMQQLTGRRPRAPETVDLRAIISEHARAMGLTRLSSSPRCTRCDNDRFFSHRAGDAGRQIGVILAPPAG